MLPTESEIKLSIGGILKNASLAKTRQFSQCESLILEEMADEFALGQVISRQMTLIVISSAELRTLIKIHFNGSEADQLRRIKFSDPLITNEQVVAAKTLDYMKELTNQVCGRVCQIFQRNNLTLGMCIPLSMRGFYEIYSDYTPQDGALKKFGQAWKIKGDFGSLVFTAYTEIMNITAVSHLQFIDEDAANDNDNDNDNDELIFL